MDFLNILHIPHLCSCRRAVLWLRKAVTSLFLCLFCCAKTGYINEYQPQKNSEAFMCSQLTGFFSFPTSALLPSPHLKIKFHSEIDKAQPKCSFYFSDTGNHFLFVYFLSWLRRPDSSFLSSERK